MRYFTTISLEKLERSPTTIRAAKDPKQWAVYSH